MFRSKNHSRKAGLPPGSLVHIGTERTKKVRIKVLDYDERDLVEMDLNSVADCAEYVRRPSVTWFNFDGIHDASIIKDMGELFKLHRLLLEDIMNTSHRPKLEEIDGALFITLKMLSWDESKGSVVIEQVSLVMNEQWVLSFQERPGDVWDPVRERIRGGKGQLRFRGTDYLVYVLIDAVVDHYFAIAEKVEDLTHNIEEEVEFGKGESAMQNIRMLKKDLIYIRKTMIPLREEVGSLIRGGNKLLDPKTVKYFGDVMDHLVYCLESLDTSKEILSSISEAYRSVEAHNMNKVMKVLTIIATIFIPMTFVAGIYGMNFEIMPELKWPYGYAFAWSLMVGIAATMMFVFKRLKWF